MKAEHPRLEEIFRDAVELPPGEARNILLSRACSGDLSLRRRVEALIHAHESAGTFMDPGFRLIQEVSGKTITTEGDAIRPGSQIGDLRVLERAAEGGLCVVYLAEQLVPMRRPVALKVLKSGVDAQLARAHFEGERQAMAVLDHPNIVQVYNAGTTSDGLPYLVMEWIQGLTVCRYADDARLSLSERLSLFLQICAAVSHAHAHGIIHCDLKPANILVPEFDGVPVPKLIDFGIAGDVRARSLATARKPVEPYLKGTPSYMSPEQAFDGDEEIDGRTDVFSLGAVLQELLTGLSAFESETGKSHDPDEVKRIITSRRWRLPSARVAESEPSMMSQLAAWRGLSPMRLASTLRGDLDAILAKALAFNRDHRYATVSDLADDLRRFLDHREVSVRPLGWYGRSSRFVRRHQAVMASGGVITGILLGAGLNTVLQSLKSRTLERRFEYQESATRLARRQAAEAQSQRLVTLGVDAINHGDVAEAMSWLGAAAQLAAPGSQERIDQVRRVGTLAAHVALPIRGLKLSGSLRWLEFSADDHYLTAVDPDGLCTVWDWQADVVLPWSQEMGSVTAVDWSPQGFQLAVGLERGRVEIRSVPSGAVVHRLDTGERVGAVRFSPDGRLLAIGGQTLRLWDMARGQWCDWAFLHPAPIFGLTYSTDGRRLASACLDRMARVFDLGDGQAPAEEPVAAFPHERGFAQVETDRCCDHSLIATDLVVPLFIERGEALLTWTAVGQLTSWDIAAGNVLGTVEGTCFSTRLVASPEGGWVGIAIRRGAAEFRPASDFLGAPAIRLEHRERICDLAFGPENNWVLSVSADRTARLWRLPRATPLLAPMKHSAAVVHGVASRQGEWIGTAQLDGLVRVWRLPLIERNTRRLSLGSMGPWNIRIAPDDQNFVLCQRGLSRSRVAMVLSVEPNRAPITRIELAGEFQDAAWSREGDFLAILTAAAKPGSVPASGRIELRRATSLNAIEREVSLPFLPVHLAWHPRDNRFLVSDADGGLWFVQLDEPARVLPFASRLDADRHREEGMEFADGGRYIVRWWTAGGVEVRNVEQGNVPFDLGAMADKSRLATLSPNGSELLLTDSEGTSILLSLAKPEGIRRMFKHAGGAVAQGFSPDGRWIATSGHDRRILVRDRLTSELAGPPLVHEDEVFDFEFSQDGSWLAAACRDGRFHVWDTRSGTALLPVWSGDESLHDVKLVAQGRWAILTGLGSKVWLRDLSGLPESTDWSLNEMILLTELVSGRAIHADPAVSMTSEEWLERMSQLHRLRPSFFQP